MDKSDLDTKVEQRQLRVTLDNGIQRITEWLDEIDRTRLHDQISSNLENSLGGLLKISPGCSINPTTVAMVEIVNRRYITKAEILRELKKAKQ